MESVKLKIRKLLALAESTTYEGERENAVIAAQRLMLQHRLSQRDVEGSVEEKVVTVYANVGREGVWWKSEMAALVANNFRCYAMLNQTSRKLGKSDWVAILGFQDDCDIAKGVIEFLVRSVPKLWNRYKNTDPRYQHVRAVFGDSRNTEYRNTWIKGFCAGLYRKFKDAVNEDQRFALVLAKDTKVVAAHKEFCAGGKARRSSVQDDMDGVIGGMVASAGFAKGKEAQLGPAVNQ